MAVPWRKFFCFGLMLACLGIGGQAQAGEIPSNEKFKAIYKQVKPHLEALLEHRGAHPGDPVFIRIFKKEKELEVWVRPQGMQKYVLLKTWPVCHFSKTFNNLSERTTRKLLRLDGWGPKLREGDWRAPEGFYRVTGEQMNPDSKRHLSFNLGYPNAYDQAHGRTGSFLMVHGGCSSVGCYAITDKGVEEVYSLVYAALKAGEPAVSVHIFPFRMTLKNMEDYRHPRWTPFGENLREGYKMFEATHIPPQTGVRDGRYVFYNR